MERNRITGTIPTEICRMESLRGVTLKFNDLRGEIPTCIDELENMEFLNLRDNELGGYVPEGLCELTLMEGLLMGNNNIRGQLPACLSQMTDLAVLHLSDSLYTGQVPSEWSRFEGLEELYLDGNFLNGNPTATINHLEALRLLYIEGNEFTGQIDETFVKDLRFIQALDISSNNFTSVEYAVPPHIFRLPELVVIDFSRNQLKGRLPTDIPQQQNMRFFSVHANMVGGEMPSQLTNLTNLWHLDLSNNEFQGPLPNELFEMRGVNSLFLSHNPGLNAGPVPSEVSKRTKLGELAMRDTSRTGPLPDLIGFHRLELLDFGDNDLTGTIPGFYGHLRLLRYMLLDRNQKLSGTLPEFVTTDLLQTVLLDKTGVTGNFSTICSLPVFAGDNDDIDGDVFVVADCGEDDSDISCDCCHCCTKDQELCSEPAVASLDWTWEFRNTQGARDFALNASLLAEPEE